MNTAAIIQARMSSNRFAGKVLYKLNGKPLLKYLLERIAQCSCLDGIIVATSDEASDVPIADFCKQVGVSCYQGPLLDAAGRFREVLDKYQFDSFVRVAGDSPLLDQHLVEKAMKIFRQGTFDIVTNVFKRTYPKGQSVEVLKTSTFINGYRQMQSPDDLEHLTKFFYRNYKNFKIFNFVSEKNYGEVQLSVDTPEDINRISQIIAQMKRPHWQYGLAEILKIYQELYPNVKDRFSR